MTEDEFNQFSNEIKYNLLRIVLTMGLLATPATSFDAEQDLLFAIFDVDGSGTMDREEFGKMMRATLRCKMTHLDFCMKNEVRMETFKQHLEGEYSTETLEFNNAVDDYRALHESVEAGEEEELAGEMNDMAGRIYEDYILEGGRRQVNILGKQRKEIAVAIASHKSSPSYSTTLPPPTLFDAAQHEIYQLMNRDTFERFKHNDALMDNMLQSLFDEVNVDHNGSITVKEYKLWAEKNPELTRFLTDLHNETFMGVSKAAGLEKRKKRRISLASARRPDEQDSDADLEASGRGSARSSLGGQEGTRTDSGRHTFSKIDVASGRKVVEGMVD